MGASEIQWETSLKEMNQPGSLCEVGACIKIGHIVESIHFDVHGLCTKDILTLIFHCTHKEWELVIELDSDRSRHRLKLWHNKICGNRSH